MLLLRPLALIVGLTTAVQAPARHFNPRWSPDGMLVGLIVSNGGTSWVEVFEVDSGRLFYTSPPENHSFSWTAARELKLGAVEIHLRRR